MPDARDGSNLLALLLALLLSGGAAVLVGQRQAAAAPAAADATVVRGVDGVVVPARAYARLLALDPAIDDILADLGLASHLVAVSAWASTHGTRALALAEVPAHLPAGATAEAVAALRPELVLVGPTADRVRTAALRRVGLRVLACGPADTVEETTALVRLVACVTGRAEAGERLARRFQGRMARLADPTRPRPRGLYCACWGTQLAGAAAGTSVHTVLTAAGIDDCAADAGRHGWPTYRAEDLVALAPAVIVAPQASAAALAALPVAPRVPALAKRRVLAIPGDLLDSTGVGMLEAAEAVADALADQP